MENQRTKSGNLIIAIGILTFGIIVYGLFYYAAEKRREENRKYIDSLLHDSRQSITFDSIRSVIDQRLTDSIRTIRVELEIERSARRRETQTIRRETQKLRHRLDSIGTIDRPDL
jgi:hypothetical protein